MPAQISICQLKTALRNATGLTTKHAPGFSLEKYAFLEIFGNFSKKNAKKMQIFEFALKSL